MSGLNARHFVLDVTLLRERVPSFAAYPFHIPAIRHLHRLEFHPAVTFLVGENGSGKSTLLEALAVKMGLNPEGGSRNFNFTTRDSLSELRDFLRVARSMSHPDDLYFLRAESFFNVATAIEQLDKGGGGPPLIESYGGNSLHEQSHGESFYALFMNRFGGHGLYLMDEPEAARSPMRQLGLLSIINDLVRQGSQLIIATHSPIILGYPRAWIYVFTEKGITRTPYQETEHYRVTRQFLEHPERMLKILMEEP